MYKIALVDDEKWVLADIMCTFPFGRYDFEVVGQFTSPRLALESLPELRPDVLFADIRMPAISGLELVGRLRPALPGLVFVVISGFAEFEYARSAIRLDVFDYCLKPMDAGAAEAILKRLSEHLAGRRGAGEYPDEYRRPFDRVLAYTDEHIFDKLVLEDLAKMFYLNANYCGQLFRQYTGKTFPRYVRDKRMDAARGLLKSTRMPIGLVASRVGYDNIHYFTRLFTEQVGFSPAQYRKKPL